MKQFAIKRTSTPAGLALSLADAKRQVYVEPDETAYDETLTDLIKAASAQVEADAQICLLSTSWVLTLQRFPSGDGAIQLPNPPLVEIDEIAYTEVNGDGAQFDQADITVFSETPALIWRNARANWPSTQVGSLVYITFTSGFVDAASIPDEAKHAIRLLVAHWFKNREAVVTGTIASETPQAYDRLIESIRTNHCFDELGVIDE